jgi:hypothetical protein
MRVRVLLQRSGQSLNLRKLQGSSVRMSQPYHGKWFVTIIHEWDEWLFLILYLKEE